ncbi:hypothetical protein KAW38_01000 [Candidatus Micrarchaeota archaeon]|nr:hypothetical protein [Candidatus Micrarchaeota archaeon]
MELVFSSMNIASMNIAEHLFQRFEKKEENIWVYGSHRLIDLKVDSILDIPDSFKGPVLVLSTHKSEKNYPAFTTHTPGNWSSADFGGEPRTLNIANGSLMVSLLKNLHKNNSLNWSVNLEVDHHGPTVSYPITYVEIGSSEKEWRNKDAGRIVADSVLASLDHERAEGSYLCAGGGHYAPLFTRMVLENGLVPGHMLPKYKAGELEEDTFIQAVEKVAEKTKGIVMDKDGLNLIQKNKIRDLASSYGLEVQAV